MNALEKMARAIAYANDEDFADTPNLHLAMARAALESLKQLDEGTVEAMYWSTKADLPIADCSKMFNAALNHMLGEP